MSLRIKSLILTFNVSLLIWATIITGTHWAASIAARGLEWRVL